MHSRSEMRLRRSRVAEGKKLGDFGVRDFFGGTRECDGNWLAIVHQQCVDNVATVVLLL